MTSRGFSIIELVIVIVIVGLLAAIAVPRLAAFGANGKYTATHQGFRQIAASLDMYHADYMAYPPNAAIETLPPEMVGYLDKSAFTTPPPIGRAWDWNGEGSGIRDHGYNLSIHTVSREDRDEMERRFDNNDPKTGIYRNQSHYLVWPVNP
ncbi:MAG: prepilin-type N-terminal cleavage/methylation domain-containing protein [Planctomycetota bacterium]